MNVWKLVAEMPSTNVRIGASILMAFGTFLLMGVSVILGKPWSPSYEWLGFLVLWAGLDVGQYIGKRTTDASYVSAKQVSMTAEQPVIPSVPQQPVTG